MKKIIKNGFIIMISVMLAFLAENLREYINERSYEKQVLAEIRRNVVGDTVQMTIHTADIELELVKLDSMIKALDNYTFHAGDTLRINLFLIRNVMFPRTSGYRDLQAFGTNLIRSDEVRKRITRYYVLKEYTEGYWEPMNASKQDKIEDYLRQDFDLQENTRVTIRPTSSKADFRNICFARKEIISLQLKEFELQKLLGREMIAAMDKDE